MFRLVLGTHNAKKLREIKSLLCGLEVDVTSLDQYPSALTVEETGETFEENARLKATQQATHLNQWVLAEDSGISVPSLGGQPGVYSARYAGPEATDEQNNQKLVNEIQALPQDKRQAFYTCQLCLADPQGTVVFETNATFHGLITEHPQGEHGFGYDPLFLVPEYHKTVAQLGPTTKSAISHRAKAMRRFRKWLVAFMVSNAGGH